MTSQPVTDAVLDDADARAARRAQQQHRRAERERALGLPPRPSVRRGERREVPDMTWQVDAACADAPEDDAVGFTEALNQQDGEELAEVYCSSCPVRDACLEAGRTGLAWGLWGGYVLTDGWLAPERPAAPRRPRQTAQEPTLKPVPTTARTQRWQPVGRRRARRKGRR